VNCDHCGKPIEGWLMFSLVKDATVKAAAHEMLAALHAAYKAFGMEALTPQSAARAQQLAGDGAAEEIMAARKVRDAIKRAGG